MNQISTMFNKFCDIILKEQLRIKDYECNALIINTLYKNLYSLFISHS
jgi:hypothetical protein